MGEASLDAAFKAAHATQIPAYTFPEDAVAAFGVLWQRARWRANGAAGAEDGRGEEARRLDGRCNRRSGWRRRAGGTRWMRRRRRRCWQPTASPRPAEFLATSPHEAADFARRVGFPVALKLISPDILHKTDIGGVILNVQDEEAAGAGFETIVARALAAHPDAHVRGVQVQKMITGGQEVIVGVDARPHLRAAGHVRAGRRVRRGAG